MEVVLTRKSHGHVDDFERSFMNMALGIKFPVLLINKGIINLVMSIQTCQKQIKDIRSLEEVGLKAALIHCPTKWPGCSS